MSNYKAGKKTVGDYVHTLEEHAHGAANVYPTLAVGTTVASSATAYTLGSFVEVVPINTITSPFDTHWVNIEAVSAAGVYELVLYGTTTEIGRIRFAALGTPNNITFPPRFIITPICAANEQIQAKLSTSNAVADTTTISIGYHTY